MNGLRKTIVIFSIITMIMTIFTVIHMGVKEGSLKNDGRFDAVSIVGEISVDGGEYEPFSPDRKFDMENNHHYVIKGHFSKDIEKNEQIMLRITDLNVKIQAEGKEIFNFWGSDTHSS